MSQEALLRWQGLVTKLAQASVGEKDQSALELLGPLMQIYGHCLAEYDGLDGEHYAYDHGSMGAQECFAKDDRGNVLFEAVPLG